MATTTLTTLRQEVLRELDLGILIPNAFFDSAAATSITSSNLLRNTNWGADHFKRRRTVIFRPGAASAADFIRYAGQLTNSTGALAHTGANYADTTVGSESVELWYDEIRPDREVLDAFNRALRDVFYTTRISLSHLSDLDGDMSASTDTNWTDVGTPTTSAKSTTGRRAPYGPRSYQLVADAANEGTQSATLPITQGKRIKTYAIASCDSGTFSHQPRDVTNGADIGTAITHSEEEPQLTMIDWQAVPATCKEVALRLLGTVNPTDFYVNQVWLYKEDVLRVNFPSFVTEHFMAPYIEYATPTGNQTASNTWNALSLEFHELTEGKDYTLLADHHPDAVPYGILLHDQRWFDYPLFIQVRRPYSDRVTFSAESDTTEAPINILKPRAKQEVLDTVLLPRGIKRDVTVYQRAEAESEWQRANASRPIQKESQRRPWGGIRRA